MSVVGGSLRFCIGSAVDIFYRRKIIDGAIPDSGPVLLVANHPNALLDPVVVMNSTSRRVRMLAKAPLFTMPGVSVLVKGLDCLPVYRAKDGADTKANAETFRAVEDALLAGSCVLIFPEGISHDEPTVQPLKTGAARMALGAFHKGATDLVVVPVGLTYADKLRYRSTAAVDIGAPIVVKDFASDGDVDDKEASRALTQAIHDALLRETTNVTSWEDLRLLEVVDAIWRQRDPERTTRIKSLADGMAMISQEQPEEVDAFRSRLSSWIDHMASIGLSPRDLSETHLEAQRQPTRAALFVLRQLASLVFGLPIAIVGAVFWAPPFWLVHLIWRISGVEKDTGATVKVLASMVFFPLWWIATVVASAITSGAVAALVTAITAPVLGAITRHFFRRRSFALRQIAGSLLVALKGDLAADARRERDALCAQLDAFGARVEALRKT